MDRRARRGRIWRDWGWEGREWEGGREREREREGEREQGGADYGRVNERARTNMQSDDHSERGAQCKAFIATEVTLPMAVDNP